ncbi:hypothetical protein [Leifsonia aquatica]|uniref:hypothetical protein n=1 Tax=Leifsonia aquatica TaxID=144185 RepID=UPI0004686EDD|nr:hypothetical protein [Leifsonia aquatica]
MAERTSRVVAWVQDTRYADPTQRGAIDHVHDDLQRMEDRILRYRTAAAPVRHHAHRELQQRIERARPGNTSPAVVATFTILGATITLILTFVVG